MYCVVRDPSSAGNYGKQEERTCEQNHVKHGPSWKRSEPMRVEITEQQAGLEEDEAGGPDRGRSAEPGKNLLRKNGLNQEQQERAQKNSGPVQQHNQKRWRGGQAIHAPDVLS